MVAAGVLSFISVILFSISCHFFIRAVIVPVPFFVSGYSRRAFQVERVYLVFAWGLMTGLFLVGLIYAFSEIYGLGIVQV